ncbi:TlpA family protein [Actinocatenispora thailandica]|uniref:TlpA family protein n=1 Tax=Actinocatenispora thailandica TaxID=227318 RepID=A0A7R7DKM6_9ACTN|nr:TlpA disulfide reductase family protein [Actinocatenispora thailandica]BCJ33459.1 TlpA family protein [Actinocatenispora thailandica]
MAYLVAAVVVFGALCLLNLVLTTAIVRRLRTLTETIGNTAAPDGGVLPAGTGIEPFAATGIDGAEITDVALRGAPGLVGFFSVGCSPCRAQLPLFAEHARRFPGGAARVLAIVNGDPAENAALVDGLRGVASIVVEDGNVGLSRHFRVAAFPVMYALDPELTVTAGGHAVDDLPAVATV